MYKIYKLTVPNGKVYIGQTKNKYLSQRCQGGLGYNKNEPLYNDILEYGWKNIQQEILEEVETKEEAIKRERFYILQYRSNEAEFGYNSHVNIPRGKKTYVVCIETGEQFRSCAEAGAAVGRTRQAINYAIKHNTLCAKFHWASVDATLD